MKLIFMLLVLSLVSVSSKNSYIVTVPKKIRAGLVADIYIHILRKRAGRTTITATLMRYNETLSRVKGNVRAGHTKLLKLGVPVSTREDRNYKIKVSGTGGVSFSKTATGVLLTAKATSLFIQTDRPIYRPGDTVRIRAFGTYPNLKAIKDPIDIIIYDPKRNRIKQFLGVRPSFGVFGGDLQLSSLTTHGNWQIEVKQLRETIYKRFRVMEYVLPKFEVNLVIPTVQLTTDKYFRLTVTAMYTFGKPVQGDIWLRLGYREGSAARKIIKQFKINGKADIRILMKEVQPRIGFYVPIFAEVTETVTGNKANATGFARILTSPVKLRFSQNQARIFKPGFQYYYFLQVTKQDDTPLDNPSGKVNITAMYRVNKNVSQNVKNLFQERRRSRCPAIPRSGRKMLFTKLVSIPTDGIIFGKILFPKGAVRGSIEAVYKKKSAFLSVQAAGSATDNFLQIRIKNKAKAHPGKTLPLIITGTEKIPVCQYKIFSKGSLVKKGKFNRCLSNNKNKHIKITTAMVPAATLLVYYVRENGEIVADAIVIPIDEIFENKVGIRYNKEGVLPAEKVQLEITADPGSLVCVLAVDKSVSLLGTGNDITVENVLYELQRYSSNFFPRSSFRRRPGQLSVIMPRTIGVKDAFAAFNSAEVYVLTDAILYQYLETSGSFGTEFIAARTRSGSRSATSGLAEVKRTRTNFPETWLWENITTGNDGTAVISATSPDTITQWIASAFAVNPRTGLGVAANLANVTTFQNFFVRLELPAWALRGEIILLKCTIFNYMPQELQVFVKLDKSEGFDFSDNNGTVLIPNGDGWQKDINVENDGIKAVVFPIILKKVGNVKIRVSARSRIISDAVERELIVKAEGIEQNYNVPILIDLRQTEKIMKDINIKFPPNAIEDSEFIKVTVIGDLLAPILRNSENLLRQGTGCGEQNMLSFSKNVFASSYFTVTKRITDELEKQIKTSLELGYQRQLTYMRTDGSFSAFGKDDKVGSTWLTAFVVKSFAQAITLTFIDLKVMDRSIMYLLNQQLRSGEFQERGIFIHKAMQGGTVSSRKSLTAFVLIALFEARNSIQLSARRTERVNRAIGLSVRYISDGSPAALKNIYELVIVLYALTLANHSSVPAILDVMEQKAVIKGDEKYWTIPPTEADIIKPWKNWFPSHTNNRALDIEVSSYALLVYNLRGETLNGIRVLKWLTRQRNNRGGFTSTQDTVVALQALTGLAEKIYSPNFDIKVTVKGDQWNGKTFDVNNNNSLVLQTEDVPSTVRKLSIDASGTGLCVVQATVYYNVPKELREPAFDLNVTVLDDSTKGFTLEICFRWTRTGNSTMGYLEVYEPTGMQAVLSSLKAEKAGGLFKKIERRFRKADLYFDRVAQDWMCIELDMTRTALVARHGFVPVQLSEYYEPSNSKRKVYRSKALSKATIIEVCTPDLCEEVKK